MAKKLKTKPDQDARQANRAFGGRGILIAKRHDRYWLHDDTCPAYQSHARTDCDCKPQRQGNLIAQATGANYADDAYTERVENIRGRITNEPDVAAHKRRNAHGMPGTGH